MRFVCKHCGYRFESSNSQKERSCPYCGNKSIIDEPNADDLLNDD